MRQILLASGTLTHALGRAIAAPRFAGLSSNTDIVVLTSLYLSGPQRPRDLGEQTNVTAGGLANLFERLESRRLITRIYGAIDGDRRGAEVSLTAHGRRLVEAIAEATRQTITEQATLLQHIGDLIDSISVRPAAPTHAPESVRRSLERVQDVARLGAEISAALASRAAPDEPAPGTAAVVLCAAAAPDGTRPRHLLEFTSLSSGGVTMLLDRLEAAGLIQRSIGRPPDRRAVTITLTDLGRRDLDARLDRALHHLDQFRSAFASPEQPTPAPSAKASSTHNPDSTPRP